MNAINLLPEDYLERRSQHRANVMCIILFVVVMAGVGGAAIVSEQSTQHTREVGKQVNAAYAEAAKLLGQIQKLERQRREGIRKARATAALLERVPRSYLLAVITQALPRNTSLSEVELKPTRKKIQNRAAGSSRKRKGSKFDAVKKRRSQQKPQMQEVMTVIITGMAATDVQVAGFITNLLQNPLLSSVNLGYSQEKVIRMKTTKNPDVPDLHLRQFQVMMELRPNVDVIDLIEADRGEVFTAEEAEAAKGSES